MTFILRTRIGIIFNATISLVCLYLRKAYLYNVYRRRVKDYIGNNTNVQGTVGDLPGHCGRFMRSDFDFVGQRCNDMMSNSLPHNLLRDQLSSGYYTATNNGAVGRVEEHLVGSLSGANGSKMVKRQQSDHSVKSRSQTGITAYDNSSGSAK
uniref:Uncharacterized protein n=1 Tax=Romanomermis culicivorax TaxID=13658 RepID=A0A915HXU0_ROMCU